VQPDPQKTQQTDAKKEAPYHPATSSSPINAWFEDHLKANGIKRESSFLKKLPHKSKP